MSSGKEKKRPPIALMFDDMKNAPYRKYTKDWNFWVGLIIPAILPVTVFILVILAELLSWDWGVGISLIFGLMCSLFLWPVIGFILASNVKIVENMRKGGKISANIGLIIGSLLGLIILSFFSGGVTN